MKQMKKYDKKNITKKIKNNFLENFNIKIICFVIAIAIYIAVGFFQLNEKTYYCRLNVTGLNENHIITNIIPETVKVIVKDKQKILNNLSEVDFNVNLDLSGMGISTGEVKIKKTVPPSVDSIFSSIKIVPDKVTVMIDSLEEKVVPVVVIHSGDPESGYAITNISVDPLEIRIQGSKKLLDRIKFIETEKIITDLLNDTLVKQANLIAPDNIRIMGKSKAEVRITVEKQ
jgi:YbbR domain-containing protein